MRNWGGGGGERESKCMGALFETSSLGICR